MARISRAMSRNRLPVYRATRSRRLRDPGTRPPDRWRSISFHERSFATSAHCDDRRISARPVHRKTVAERGGFFAGITNLVQLFVPTLDIRAVRRLLAAGD